MKNTKFVKARCDRTGAAFGLEVKQSGTQWKVVDFVRLTEEQDKKIESQVTVSRLETAKSIQACAVCGSRTVGGCACSDRRSDCRKDEPYRYQCVFCKKLRLDYSAASEAREGETVTLSQGQVVKLIKRGVSISKLLVGMGWKAAKSGSNIDLDSSVVMLTEKGEIYDTVYYANLTDPDNSIKHMGDNLYGSKNYIGQTDDETIHIKLSAVPAHVTCLAFIVNIYQAKERNQTLKTIRKMHIHLTEANSGQKLYQYNYDAAGLQKQDTGLIIGAAYRSAGEWRFLAIGKSFAVDDVDELAEFCREQCEKQCRGRRQ